MNPQPSNHWQSQRAGVQSPDGIILLGMPASSLPLARSLPRISLSTKHLSSQRTHHGHPWPLESELLVFYYALNSSQITFSLLNLPATPTNHSPASRYVRASKSVLVDEFSGLVSTRGKLAQIYPHVWLADDHSASGSRPFNVHTLAGMLKADVNPNYEHYSIGSLGCSRHAPNRCLSSMGGIGRA